MKSVVVLGGRSGTSLTAGMLHIAGVHMGDKLRAPDASGPTGYYENMEFVKMTSDMIGTTDDGGARVYQAPKIRNTELGDLMNMRDLVWRSEREPIWGFKAPGSVYLLPLYELFLRDPHYIVCKRDPQQVAKSLEKRKDFEPENKTWLEIAELFQKSLMERTEGKKRYIMEFERLIEEPEVVFDEMMEFLEHEVSDKIREGAINLVNPGYRHQKGDSENNGD